MTRSCAGVFGLMSRMSPSMSSTRVSSSKPPDSTSWWYSSAVRRWTSSLSVSTATPRIISPSPHQPPDRAHELVGRRLGRLLADQAVAGVPIQEPERDLVERRLDRADLRQHVDAVAVLFDHARDAADLALD